MTHPPQNPYFATVSRRLVLRLMAVLAAVPAARPFGAQAATGPFVTEVAPGLYVHQGQHALFAPENEGDISNCGFVIGSDAVAVVDTGGSAIVGARLLAEIRKLTDRPVRYVINSHMHPDHIFGNAPFATEGTEFVAHHKMARGLAARAERYMSRNKELLGDKAFEGIRIVTPTRGIDTPTALDLGGRSIDLRPQKTAHTDNDLVVRCQKTNTVFMGDLIFSGHVPTIDGSIRGWLAVMNDLTNDPADRIVPGHGPASMPWPDAARPLQGYLDKLAADVRALIKSGKTISDAMTSAGQSEKSAWLLFDDYNARNASAAFAELEWE